MAETHFRDQETGVQYCTSMDPMQSGVLLSLVDTAPRLTGRTATVPARFDCLDSN
jgi:hypothetical protein